MLTEKEIQEILHASRVVPLSVNNPHGPLGLEELAAAVARVMRSPDALPQDERIRLPISLSVKTWEKLDKAATDTLRNGSNPLTASEIATAIIEQFVSTNP